MRPEHQSNTQPRLLRKAALSEATAAMAKRRGTVDKVNTGRGAGDLGQSAGATEKPPARPREEPGSGPGEQRPGEIRTERRSSRFMGPAQLDETRKASIAAALEAANIGDEVGRQIFIGALEYQLSAFGPQLRRRDEGPGEEPPSPPADDALIAVSEAAHALAERLGDLGESSQRSLAQTLIDHDRLGRRYDQAYLRLLACEIERIAQACRTAPQEAAEPEVPATDPGPSRDLVAKLGSVYSDCFEEEPTAEAGGRFATLLAVLSEETGLVIGHDPAFLADIIGP
jgi:hypothetical protein